jgi:hypothetical protein
MTVMSVMTMGASERTLQLPSGQNLWHLFPILSATAISPSALQSVSFFTPNTLCFFHTINQHGLVLGRHCTVGARYVYRATCNATRQRRASGTSNASQFLNALLTLFLAIVSNAQESLASRQSRSAQGRMSLRPSREGTQCFTLDPRRTRKTRSSIPSKPS